MNATTPDTPTPGGEPSDEEVREVIRRTPISIDSEVQLVRAGYALALSRFGTRPAAEPSTAQEAVRDEREAFVRHIQATEQRTPLLWSEAFAASSIPGEIPAHTEGKFYMTADQKAWLAWQARASHPTKSAAPAEPAGLLARAKDLHEKAGMPWSDAEELALTEAGIDGDAIDKLIGECGYAGLESVLSDADELRQFTRSVLVHQPLATPPAAIPEAPAACNFCLDQAREARDALTRAANYIDALSGDSKTYRQILAASPVHVSQAPAEPTQAGSAGEVYQYRLKHCYNWMDISAEEYQTYVDDGTSEDEEVRKLCVALSRQAPAAPAEPIAEIVRGFHGQSIRWFDSMPMPEGTKLYAAPTPAEPAKTEAVTDEHLVRLADMLWERGEIQSLSKTTAVIYARAVIALKKEADRG